MSIRAFLTDPFAAGPILRHAGLPASPPPLTPARFLSPILLTTSALSRTLPEGPTPTRRSVLLSLHSPKERLDFLSPRSWRTSRESGSSRQEAGGPPGRARLQAGAALAGARGGRRGVRDGARRHPRPPAASGPARDLAPHGRRRGRVPAPGRGASGMRREGGHPGSREGSVRRRARPVTAFARVARRPRAVRPQAAAVPVDGAGVRTARAAVGQILRPAPSDGGPVEAPAERRSRPLPVLAADGVRVQRRASVRTYGWMRCPARRRARGFWVRTPPRRSPASGSWAARSPGSSRSTSFVV
jgi:hypothetical protein